MCSCEKDAAELRSQIATLQAENDALEADRTNALRTLGRVTDAIAAIELAEAKRQKGGDGET